MYDKDELKAAVMLLVNGSEAVSLHETLIEAVRVANKLPIKLTGDAARVNPLLWLAQTNYPKFEEILERIDMMRVKAGVSTLEPKGFQKNPYQAEFMAQKRLRQSRALRLENAQRPARDHLKGNAKLEFERVVQAQWKKQLDAMIGKARTAAGGARLKKEMLDSIRERFWAGVDTALDEKEADIKRRV